MAHRLVAAAHASSPAAVRGGSSPVGHKGLALQSSLAVEHGLQGTQARSLCCMGSAASWQAGP